MVIIRKKRSDLYHIYYNRDVVGFITPSPRDLTMWGVYGDTLQDQYGIYHRINAAKEDARHIFDPRNYDY